MWTWRDIWGWFGGADRPAVGAAVEPAPKRPTFSRAPRRSKGVAKGVAKGAVTSLAKGDARARILDLHLRGAIFTVTKAAQIVGYDIQILGPVRGRDQIAALAARHYPMANAVIGLRALPRQGRKLPEVAGEAVIATPRDLSMAAPAYQDRSVLVDGSNVIAWAQDAGLAQKPSMQPLQALLRHLRGQSAVVVFDATIGARLFGREAGTEELAARLGAPVIIAPRGTLADQVLITLARRDGAVIISNDHFRDNPRARHLLKQKGYATAGGITLLPPRP